METKITDNYFEYSTVKYFRGVAEDCVIGSYGKKRDPIGARAHLDVQTSVKDDYLASRVKYITTVDIDWSQTTKADVEVNGQLQCFGLNTSAAVGMSYENAKNGKLKLTKFGIDEAHLTGMLNNDAVNARNYLADEGSDGRIVSEIWVVVDGKLGEHFSAYGSLSGSVKANGNGLEFSATGGSNGQQTITLSKGTTFAYLMYKVKDWSNSKTHIEDMEPDYKGMG